ncbi:MAG: DMT family transporter, partial [Pseudomonadota bacterium]
PIWATILGAVVHRELVGPRRIAAIAAGFAGALVILRPGIAPVDLAMLAALGSSFLFACALTLSRAVASADGPVATFVSSVLITCLIAAPVAAPVFALPETLIGWAATAVLVATGAIRNVADIEAYRHGEASVLAPITYLRIALIGVAAFFLFGEVPDAPTVAGAAIIIGATLYIARREARLAAQKR